MVCLSVFRISNRPHTGRTIPIHHYFSPFGIGKNGVDLQKRIVPPFLFIPNFDKIIFGFNNFSSLRSLLAMRFRFFFFILILPPQQNG